MPSKKQTRVCKIQREKKKLPPKMQWKNFHKYVRMSNVLICVAKQDDECGRATHDGVCVCLGGMKVCLRI